MPNIGKYIGIWAGEFVVVATAKNSIPQGQWESKIANWHMNCTQGFNPKEMVWCEMVWVKI